MGKDNPKAQAVVAILNELIAKGGYFIEQAVDRLQQMDLSEQDNADVLAMLVDANEESAAAP